MPSPVKRTNLSEQVFVQLRDEILNREYEPGQRLPSERALCKIMQVNRGPMREALKRLEQAGLIEIQQGNGTVVLDYELHAGPELLPALAMPGGRPNFDAVRSMFECRALIAPEMARLAALRIDPAALDELTEIVEAIEACDDTHRLQELDVAFHGALARASGNITYRLLYNSARDLYRQFMPMLLTLLDGSEEARSHYRRTRDAVVAQDAEGACAACAELMGSSHARALALIEQIAGAAGGAR